LTPRLPVVTSQQLARVAERLGFHLDRQKGSHAVYCRDSDGARIVIPMHAGKSLKPKTLSGILDDMGISPDHLREIL